jgi:hypothetical protein
MHREVVCFLLKLQCGEPFLCQHVVRARRYVRGARPIKSDQFIDVAVRIIY